MIFYRYFIGLLVLLLYTLTSGYKYKMNINRKLETRTILSV